MDSPNSSPSPLTAEQLDGRTLARARRDAMRRRARRIRRSVAGFAAAVFSTGFLVVYVQLASGHDPALSKRTTTAAAKTATAPAAASSGSTSNESSGAASTEEASKSASAVTTSQS